MDGKALNGCYKNSVSGLPLRSGSDACHTHCKNFIGWRVNSFQLVIHDICDECGLDTTVFYSEREKEVQIPLKTG